MREGLYLLMDANKLVRITHVDRLRDSRENRYVIFAEYGNGDYGRWFIEAEHWELFKNEFYWIGQI